MEPHASVRLDPNVEAGHVHHEHVEPIPWKTGRVGAVDAIDRDTSWVPKREAAPKKKSCNDGDCGCKSKPVMASAIAPTTDSPLPISKPAKPKNPRGLGRASPRASVSGLWYGCAASHKSSSSRYFATSYSRPAFAARSRRARIRPFDCSIR